MYIGHGSSLNAHSYFETAISFAPPRAPDLNEICSRRDLGQETVIRLDQTLTIPRGVCDLYGGSDRGTCAHRLQHS